MDGELVIALQAFEADHAWIDANLEMLLSLYADQWIAVQGSQVVASNPDLSGLMSILADPAHTCVEFITREPLEMIL